MRCWLLKKHCQRFLLAFLFSAVLCFGWLGLARAEPIPGEIGKQLGEATQGAEITQQEPDVRIMIVKIISATFGLIGIILVGLLVYAGWSYMTAGGDDEKVTKAKTIIRNAIIGLVIVLLAYAISHFVINALLKTTGALSPAPS